MSSVTSGVCRGGVYLLYLHSFAFKYRYILYILCDPDWRSVAGTVTRREDCCQW
jgi:hypothetical protein